MTGDGASNTYAYDGNGNPTTYKNATLTFDPENRLTQFGTTLSCGYTAEGLRAWKRSGTGTPNFYLYDGDDPICELDGGDGSFKRVNTWGANGLVSRITKASSTGYYTYDPEGNLCQLLNGGAGVSVTYHTDAFGNVTSSNGSGATFAFGAQWGYSADSETGFVLCGHRFYDPTNGRWITRDPIGYDGGVNLYGYCSDNPANMVDPSGLKMSKQQCAALLQSIITQANTLLSEWATYDPIEDGKGGHTWYHGGQTGITRPGGHYDKMMMFKQGLKNRISLYIRECLNNNDDDNPGLPQWCSRLSHRPIPVPIFPSDPLAQASNEKLVLASILASIAVVGIIYATKGSGGAGAGIAVGRTVLSY